MTKLTYAEKRFRTSVIEIFRNDGFGVEPVPGELSASIDGSLGVPMVHFDMQATMPTIPELFQRMRMPASLEALVVSSAIERPFVVMSLDTWQDLLRAAIELDKRQRAEREEKLRPQREAKLAEIMAALEAKQ